MNFCLHRINLPRPVAAVTAAAVYTAQKQVAACLSTLYNTIEDMNIVLNFKFRVEQDWDKCPIHSKPLKYDYEQYGSTIYAGNRSQRFHRAAPGATAGRTWQSGVMSGASHFVRR